MPNTAKKLALYPRSVDRVIYQQALTEGVHPLLAKILAGRLNKSSPSISALIEPSLKQLAPPTSLADIQLAVERLKQAVMQGEIIGLLTDYDVDGITSHVVIYRTLTQLLGVPAERIQSLIGHRIEDGYGVSDSLTDRILATNPLPAVIITADCGSSDELRLARLKAAGIDVLVTDHHALPKEGPPASAYAVINPTREDCNYPDKTLAGCGVAWLLMTALRNCMVQEGLLAEQTPKLSFLLPFVALGTVADCVSLGGSAINRALVRAGLQIMNTSDEACWQAFRQLMGNRFQEFTASTLGFQLGPRINASSRMADPYDALLYLLAKTPVTAAQHLALLDSDNQQRRSVEADMVNAALKGAKEQVDAGMQSLVAYLEEGHSGVQGIVASRLVEKYGRPTVVLTPTPNPKHLVASARSVEGVNLHAALQRIDELHPSFFVKFGGHQAAAGFTLRKEHLVDFQQAFEKAILYQLGERTLAPYLLTDGELEPSLINLETFNLLKKLEPYGREFEAPVFDGMFQLAGLRVVGADPVHLQLELSLPNEATLLKAIWFRALPQAGASFPFQVGDQIRLVYRLEEQQFRGKTSLQLMVSYAELVI
ncbi:MAG: single-stranded-DNA-specific exonuclease RecJ [Pseudomonadaceae bacterium]|nr:single-stranded-DNA-specific exonuclease RecJ [Pseudomonadaceae bacterium]